MIKKIKEELLTMKTGTEKILTRTHKVTEAHRVTMAEVDTVPGYIDAFTEMSISKSGERYLEGTLFAIDRIIQLCEEAKCKKK